jgi:hypothetical protein
VCSDALQHDLLSPAFHSILSTAQAQCLAVGWVGFLEVLICYIDSTILLGHAGLEKRRCAFISLGF